MKIEIQREGKAHAQIKLDGEEDFCTIYGSDWKKKLKLMQEAFEVYGMIMNRPKAEVDAHIKRMRSKK